ncbi:MAG TPA: DNA gyrase inhibitor YacG [Geminicoccaceae bacterium]
MANPRPAARTPPRCPICGRPRDPKFRPFCSKRCRQVDLSRWMNEVYAVPALDADPEEDGGEEDGSRDEISR